MVQTDGRIALFQNGPVGWGIIRCIIVAYGSCNRVRQLAPMCTRIMVPWAHASLPTITNGIAIGSSVLVGIIGLPNTQTTERATSVAMGRICAMHAM